LGVLDRKRPRFWQETRSCAQKKSLSKHRSLRTCSTRKKEKDLLEKGNHLPSFGALPEVTAGIALIFDGERGLYSTFEKEGTSSSPEKKNRLILAPKRRNIHQKASPIPWKIAYDHQRSSLQEERVRQRETPRYAGWGGRGNLYHRGREIHLSTTTPSRVRRHEKKGRGEDSFYNNPLAD